MCNIIWHQYLDMYTGILILGPEGSNINIDSNLDICVFMIHIRT